MVLVAEIKTYFRKDWKKIGWFFGCRKFLSNCDVGVGVGVGRSEIIFNPSSMLSKTGSVPEFLILGPKVKRPSGQKFDGENF